MSGGLYIAPFRHLYIELPGKIGLFSKGKITFGFIFLSKVFQRLRNLCVLVKYELSSFRECREWNLSQITTENVDKSEVSEIKQQNGQKFELGLENLPKNSDSRKKNHFLQLWVIVWLYIYAKRAMFRRENSCHTIWRIKHPRYEQRPWFSG